MQSEASFLSRAKAFLRLLTLLIMLSTALMPVTAHSESIPPVTTPTPIMGTYGTAQSVTLSCSDGAGSGCAATYYCLGSGCTPTTPYSGPVSIATTTTLSYYSTDLDGNSEQVRTYAYTVDPALSYRFERLWPQLQQPWYFYNPTGIARDVAGNIYIVDRMYHRIQKFDPNGAFVTAWGTKGSGTGQFNTPEGAAISADGYIYVADTYNYRIQKFTVNGSFVTAWGSSGSGNGLFNAPQGVAVDSSGNVYVVDSGNSRVQKFTSGGSFVVAWGSSGNGNGQFSSPSGIAIDSAGNIYVSDSSNNRIQKFDSTGAFMTAWGSFGTANGQLWSPKGLFIDADGNVYVADSSNGRVQKFTANGVFVKLWGGSGQMALPSGVVVDAGGSLYVTDCNNHRIQKYDPAGILIASWVASSSASGQFSSPRDIALTSTGTVYVADTNNHRIQKFDAAGAYVTSWGTKGSASGQFNGPSAIALDPAGYLYVSDTLNNRIQKFTADGSFLAAWGTNGSGNGQFNSPTGIALDSVGNVYVVDPWNYRIQKFTANGTFITSWGSNGGGNGQFSNPRAIAIDASDNLYVADSQNNRIQKFTSDGTYVTKWGSFGSSNGMFKGPQGVATDSAGNIYVSDLNNYRIQKFTSSGVFVTAWGSFGSGNAHLNIPDGIAVDSVGNVYIADSGNNRFQKFNPAPQSFPGAPTGVTAAAGNNQATVTFTPPVSNGGSTITTYTVTSSPGNITASGSASPITVTGLAAGSAYSFTVTATNATGTGPASGPSGSVTPYTNYSLALTVNGNGTVHSTPAPDINCTGSCGQSYANGTGVTLSATPASGFTFGGWSGACSGTGSCSFTMSQAQNITAEFIDTSPPGTAPSPVAGTYGSTRNVTLTCTDGGGSGCSATYYCLGAGCTPATLYSSAITIANSTELRFYSVDTAANSESVKAAVYTLAAPSAPVAIAATTVTQSSFTARWNTAVAADGYLLDVATDSSFSSFVTGFNGLDTGNVSNYSVTGLSAATTYSYRVRAYNGYGSSADSNTITQTTSSAVVISGNCGSASGGNYSLAPTTGLCFLGTPSSVNGIGPWNWNCVGSNGGSTASCSAAQAGGLVHKSANAGVNWTPGKTGLGFNNGINAMLASPAYSSDRTLFLGAMNGIYKSSDSGDTWTQVQSSYTVKALAASPSYASDRTIFAGAFLAGVYKSTDAGATWALTNTGLGNTMNFSLALSPVFASDRTIFAGMYAKGVYKSTDSGATWSAANTGIDTLSVLSMTISPAYSSDRTVFAATADGGGAGAHYHVYKSVDAGASWNLADTGLTGTMPTLGISPAFASDQTLFAVTGSGTYKSTNGGNSWTQALAASGGNGIALSPAYASDQTLLVSVYGDNVYRSSNGGSSWSPSSSGFTVGNKQLTTLALSPAFADDQTVFTATSLIGPYMTVGGDLSFGNVKTNSSSTVRQLTITNGNLMPSDANLAISGLTLTGAAASQFSIAPGTCGSLTPVLAVGASCSFDLTFTPGSDGSKSATLQFTTNDPQNPSWSGSLSGTGITVTSTIATPNNNSATNSSSVIVTGAATCSGGCTVALVEVSADNGITWLPATGTTSWSASVPTATTGGYTIKSRAWTGSGISETPGSGITVTVDRLAPTGSLALYFGVWTLNANARDGDMCFMVYPSLCGQLEMSFNGFSGWQAATMTPGTSGPLWLRDRAGNVSGPFSGEVWNATGGPIRVDGGMYYSSLQHAFTAAASGNIIKLTTTPHSENLVAATSAALTLRGGYNSSHSSVSGTTPLSGNLTVQAGTLTVENLDLTGIMTIEAGAVTANSITIL